MEKCLMSMRRKLSCDVYCYETKLNIEVEISIMIRSVCFIAFRRIVYCVIFFVISWEMFEARDSVDPEYLESLKNLYIFIMQIKTVLYINENKNVQMQMWVMDYDNAFSDEIDINTLSVRI